MITSAPQTATRGPGTAPPELSAATPRAMTGYAASLEQPPLTCRPALGVSIHCMLRSSHTASLDKQCQGPAHKKLQQYAGRAMHGLQAPCAAQEAEEGREEKRRRHDLRELRPLDTHRDDRRSRRHRDEGPHYREDRDRDRDLYERSALILLACAATLSDMLQGTQV